MTGEIIIVHPDRTVERRDQYADNLLDGAAGIIIGGGADQIALDARRDELTAFVEAGGRIQINGHVQRPFLPGLTRWRKLDFERPRDLRISTVTPHPVWEGVDPDLFWFQTGVPGTHTLEEMQEIGVAGFYGRGYHLDLPEGAVVINGIGQLRAPIDWEYPLGAGRVLVHAGNDLLGFAKPGTASEALCDNLGAWLVAR